MGNLKGHVAPGLAFCIIGLWHLFNHIKLHARKPSAYVSLPWFPTRFSRHLELYFIIFASATSISMELFIMPHNHHPFDTDATIPSNHLHNFEHSNISLSIFSYAVFAILLDKINPPARSSLTHMLGVTMLAQEFLLFNLHSTDHVELEGQYHWLLQIVILTALATGVTSINYPRSFLLSFARSLAVFAQGVWLIVIGYMLYTPRLLPKGCVLRVEDGHHVVKCEAVGAVERAKSLANILFSYYVVGVSMVGVVLYLVIYRMYSCEGGEVIDEGEGEQMKGPINGKGITVVNLEC